MSADTENIEKYLEKLIEGQKQQAAVGRNVLSEVEEIRESVRRLHNRLDDTAKETTINTQNIKFLNTRLDKGEAICKDERELIWKKMHEHKKEAIVTAVKNTKIWIYSTFMVATGALGTAIFGYFINKVK